MPVNLSIKNVPDDVAERLRRRAARNHRSLQGELMAMVERAASDGDTTIAGARESHVTYRDEAADVQTRSVARERTMTVHTMKDTGHATKMPLRWPSEAARLVRDTRDLEGDFEDTPDGPRRMRRLNASEILMRMRALGIRTPGSATDIVRQMRDERHR